MSLISDAAMCVVSSSERGENLTCCDPDFRKSGVWKEFELTHLPLPLQCKLSKNSHYTRFIFLQVFLGDYSSDPAGDDDSVKCMGYCPQINPLWPEITLQEHFEIYGAVKGMSASDMKEVIIR